MEKGSSCLVFDAAGKSLIGLLNDMDGRRLPMRGLKLISRQILLGLQFLHDKCDVTHTDIKLSNILLSFTEEQNEKLQSCAKKAAEDLMTAHASGSDSFERASKILDDLGSTLTGKHCLVSPESLTSNSLRVALIDYGQSCIGEKRLTGNLQSMSYRAPETILRCGYTTTIDIWSFACVVYGLATGQYLFYPRLTRRCSIDEDHLAQMVEIFGSLPSGMVDKGARSNMFFDNNGRLKLTRKLKKRTLGDMLSAHMDISEARELESFLSAMLELDFEKRPSATEMLQHPFVNNEETVRDTNRVMGIENCT